MLLLPSYIRIVRRTCKPFAFSAARYTCNLLRKHFCISMTRPRQLTTWLSLVSQPSISRLDAFTQSFKHFKDGFFKAVVKEARRSYFYNYDRSTKFFLSLTDNPWRYKDMKIKKLSVANKEVVETPMKFNDRLPTKGLIRVYNSVHLIVEIEGIFL